MKKFRDLKSNLTRISTERNQVNESAWESYRDRALSESLDQPPFEVPTMTPEQIAKKHGVSVATINLQLKHGIEVEAEHTPHRDKAREIALDHLGERPDYYKRLAKYVEVQEEVVQEGKKKLHTPLPGSYEWRKRGLPMPKKELPYGKLKKFVNAKVQEGFDSSFYEGGEPDPGHVMNFSSHTEHGFHGFKSAKEARDKYAKHLQSQGHKVKKHMTSNQLLHGSYGNVYKVSYKPSHLKENVKTPHEVLADHEYHPTYQSKRGQVYRHPNGLHSLVMKGDGSWEHYHVHSQAGHVLLDSGDSGSLAGHLSKVHRVDVHEQTERERASHSERMGPAPEPEHYKVGDQVIPHMGPHKNQLHTVIHVHPTGHVNIKPVHSRGRQNRYHLGAAKASPSDISRAPVQESSGSIMRHFMKKKNAKDVKYDAPWHIKPQGKTIDRPNPTINPISRKTVQEAFQAAKDKKKAQDAQPQKELQDSLPQDGGKDPNQNNVPGGPPKPEKKSNVPTPEKKSGKIQVKGPGPDDKFQGDPIVTPLTTMPDRGNGDYKRNG